MLLIGKRYLPPGARVVGMVVCVNGDRSIERMAEIFRKKVV